MATAFDTSPRPIDWTETTSALSTWTMARTWPVALAIVLGIGLLLRLDGLNAYGLSEDEMNKVSAIAEYRAGRFAANAEHPMLMKLAMWGSVAAAERWNSRMPAAPVPLETALRLPNAVAGAVTAALVFGVAETLFGAAVGTVAAAIWAVDVNAIAINRIGKEDTFLLLFFLAAVFCYERGKRTGRVDLAAAQRWYGMSGASFGVMLASKYMPHLLGIYAIFNTITDRDPGANRPQPVRFYALMVSAFAAANPVILMPATWRYMWSYAQGRMLAHHGYAYAGSLYVTDVPVSPLGVPATFYLRLLATKIPLVVLAAVVPGIVEIVRRRRERGFVLVRVLAVFLIVPYSLMAAKFLRYSLPMLFVVDVVAAVGLVSGTAWLLRKGWLTPSTRVVTAAAAVVTFAIGAASAAASAAPFYSFFQNGIGAATDPSSAVFPEQSYDYGVREAVSAIARVAVTGSVVASDAPSVVRHYLADCGRADIGATSLSTGWMPPGVEQWALVQDEHATFENEELVRQLRARQSPWLEIRARDRVTTQVFRLTRSAR